MCLYVPVVIFNIFFGVLFYGIPVMSMSHNVCRNHKTWLFVCVCVCVCVCVRVRVRVRRSCYHTSSVIRPLHYSSHI